MLRLGNMDSMDGSKLQISASEMPLRPLSESRCKPAPTVPINPLGCLEITGISGTVGRLASIELAFTTWEVNNYPWIPAANIAGLSKMPGHDDHLISVCLMHQHGPLGETPAT